MSSRQSPLVLFATHPQQGVCRQVHQAAKSLNMPYRFSDRLPSLTRLGRSPETDVGCVVVDIESGTSGSVWRGAEDLLAVESWPTLFTVPKGQFQSTYFAIAAGAWHILEKPFRTSELVRHVRAAICCHQSLKLDKHPYGHFLEKGLLDSREVEVLAGLMNSMTNRQLAGRLRLGLRTIETIRAGIIRKLGVSSFVELVRLVERYRNIHAWERQQYIQVTLARQSSEGAPLPRPQPPTTL